MRKKPMRASGLAREMKLIKDQKEKDTGESMNTKQGDAKQPPKPMDRKDIDKPERYSGAADAWLKWSRTFKRFLRRQDARWPLLLDEVEKKKGRPVTKEDEVKWDEDLGLGGHVKMFKEQLNEYLESYTSSAARLLVEACGDTRALDAWRQLADKGHSLREQHIHALRRKAYFPKAASQLKDLEAHISMWETDIELFIAATKESFPEPNMKMNLIDMCPEKLRAVLKEREHRLPTYGDVKLEIADWLADNAGAVKHGRAAALEPAELSGEEDEIPWGFDPELASHQELLALVKNKFFKKGKGKGKGKDAPNSPMIVDHSEKDCFDCGEKGHIARDCPVKKARVAAGGPERLPGRPKGGGKGKGGGKAPWQPTKGQWRNWFPGPRRCSGTRGTPRRALERAPSSVKVSSCRAAAGRSGRRRRTTG